MDVTLQLIDCDNENRIVTLRELNWLVENYSKKLSISYEIVDDNKQLVDFNLHNEYKNHLGKYNKVFFDVFMRRHRYLFYYNGTKFISSIGQLNFMYWAIKNSIIECAIKHIDEIRREIKISNSKHYEILE